MNEQTGIKTILTLAVLFIGLPVFLYATGSFPRRTILKESISILTIMAFFLMLAQFFLARTNRRVLSGYRVSSIITIHKVLGYVFLSVLLVHPFLIVVPRYFESGIDSMEAFITIITSFNSLGIVLGICAWCLMLILGVTSFLRKKLPLRYKNWRLIHGIFAILFIILASWHAIDLGRHATLTVSTYLVVAAMSGILLLLKSYIARSPMEQGVNK